MFPGNFEVNDLLVTHKAVQTCEKNKQYKSRLVKPDMGADLPRNPRGGTSQFIISSDTD